MFIPTQTPDLQQPLTQLLETKPVQPVSAVPGIPEDAQHLDSRVALQWAQPVLPMEKGQSARNAQTASMAVQIVKALNSKGFEPQGPDPDALRKGEVHPMLAKGLASWIQDVLSKPVSSFRAQAFRDLTAQAKAAPKISNGEELPKTSEINSQRDDVALDTVTTPVKSGTEKPSNQNQAAPALFTSKFESPLMANLLNLYKDLAKSDIFAAQRLSETWLPRPTKSQGEAVENLQTSQAEKNAVAAKQGLSFERGNVVQDEFKSLSQPVSEPSVTQLAKWVAALEPDSEYSQQAAHLLTQGQMAWQSELAPGIPMRIVREDAWRNPSNRPTQLEKGAMLKVEVELHNLGRIRISGSQWGQDLSLQIAYAASVQDRWTSVTPSLLQDLKASGISDVRLETLADDPEVPHG